MDANPTDKCEREDLKLHRNNRGEVQWETLVHRRSLKGEAGGKKGASTG